MRPSTLKHILKLSHLPLVLSGLLVLPVNYCLAQKLVFGSVKDSLTSEPVAFATVGIAGTTKGTITNEKGDFIIRIDSLPWQLLISCTGYKSTAINAEKSRMLITLVPSNTFLKPVTVKAGEADRLFMKTFAKLKEENQNCLRSKAFFRLTTKTENRHTEMIESFYTAYLNNTGIQSWDFEQGRYALLKDAKQNIIVSLDFSSLNRQTNLFNKGKKNSNIPDFPFRNKALSHYLFTIAGRYLSGNDEIIKLRFEHRTDNFGYFYSGIIHVNSKDFRIMQVEAFTKNVLIPPISPSSPFAKIDSFEINLNIKYQLINGVNAPYYIQYDIRYRYTPAFSPKSISITTQSKLLIYEYETKPVKLKSVPGDSYHSDYDLIEQNLYLPWFWENNQVLAETPVEKRIRTDFEENKSFGKAFNSENDTSELTKDGYYVLKKHQPINLKDIPLTKVFQSPQECFVFAVQHPATRQIDTIGGLYSDFYFAYNCYNDTFYHVLLPLIDLQATFFTNECRNNPYLEQILSLYCDLLQCYVLEFRKYVSGLQNPCVNKELIKIKYAETLNAFKNEKILMLEQVWEDKELGKWQTKISKRLLATESNK